VKELYTLSRKEPFYYEGSVGTDTTVLFGEDGKAKVRIKARIWQALLDEFSGDVAPLGRSPRSPSPGSLGEWLLKKTRRRGLASYVGPILIHEGYAELAENGQGTCLKFADLSKAGEKGPQTQEAAYAAE